MNTSKLVSRAKSILLTPKTEWPVIAAEPESVGGLYTGYIMIMAAIPIVIRLLSSTIVGVSVPTLGTFRVGASYAITFAVVGYLTALAGVYIVALIVDGLAPTFGGTKDRMQALKVVAYSYTATWVASIVGIVPSGALTVLALLAGLVYGIYLLWLGLPVTMKNPPDRSGGYTAVTIIVAIVVYVILAILVGAIVRPIAGPIYGFGRPLGSTLHEHGSFASGSTGAALQAWSERVTDASKQMDAAQKSGDTAAQANAASALVGAALGSGGKVESLPPDRIRSFAPETLAGLKRTELSAERNAAMGVQISKATATYSDGAGHNLELEITDTGSLKGLVGFASGWAGVEQEKETDSGYEKTYKSNDRLVHERWDNRSGSGEYGVIVAERFSVNASGTAASIQQLKSAVEGVDLAGLGALKSTGVQAN